MNVSDGLLRAQAFEAYENIPSLDTHGELARLILAEVSLLTEKYRHVRRHDVPHIRELSGLLDVLWQEVEMEFAAAHPDEDDSIESLPLFRWASLAPARGIRSAA
ncbi:hypothetical protein [Sphingosinicella terrae]|jgi:hypothetical protein|uniref:hypothetical protein n=1 Tax=Sphingosinicella terrae TaxID=2172047 RepID=UPI000E0DEC58|nr:hypothetical protein [Sphingosinicella terrae]